MNVENEESSAESANLQRVVIRHDRQIDMIELVYPRLDRQAWSEAMAEMELLCAQGFQFLENKICSATHWRIRLIKLPEWKAPPHDV